jgi:hypothetical protein
LHNSGAPSVTQAACFALMLSEKAAALRLLEFHSDDLMWIKA